MPPKDAAESPDFRAIFEATPTPLLLVAPPDWTIVAANDARLQVTATSREGQIGRRLFEVFPDDPNDPEADGVRKLTASFERVLATRSTDTMAVQRYSVREPDGQFAERWWTPVNTPVLDSDGEVALIIHRVEEVTELVRLRGDADARDQLGRDQQALIDRLRASEAALRVSEEFNRRILASSADCIKVLDLDARLVFMSEGGMCVMEVDEFRAVQGEWWPGFWTGEEHAKALSAIEAAKSGSGGRFQGFARTLKGSPRWWDVVVTPMLGPDGSPEKLLAVSRDITAAKEAEARLRGSEERFRLMADAVPQIVWITDAEGRVEFFNKQWSNYTGEPYEPTTAAEVAANFLHPEDTAATIAAFDGSRRSGTTYSVEHRIRSATGEYRWFLVRGEPYRDPATGKISRWFGASVDIHDRKVAEERLRELNATLETRITERTTELSESQRRFQGIFDSAFQFMALLEADGTVLEVNRTALAWSQIEPADIVGKPFWLAAPMRDNPSLQDAIRIGISRAAAGETVRAEHEMRGAGEVRATVDFSLKPVFDGRGDPVWLVAEGRDITDLKVAQEALRQSQKLEAMGQLTGGVAHDVNNLLSPILGSLDFLQRKEIGGEREQRMISGALQATERVQTLVQRLLAFARRQPLQPRPVDVGALVEGMADLIASTSGPQTKVVTDVPPDLPAAVADPNQLEMAILNLAVNARDAMPDGGRLTVSARSDTVTAVQPGGLAPGRYLRLSVADTGYGMDEVTLKRAVEPFFSTKGLGKGTGLGLSMAHGLASQLGGALTIESKIGLGTKVELCLPATEVPAEPAEVAENLHGIRTVGTALVVDDEDLVRASTATMLTELGYEVVEAESAEEALLLIDEGLDFQALVTDHLMPGKTGSDLARQVLNQRPGTRVLLVSGYAEVDGVAPDLPRLAKPFRQADLAAKLEALFTD
jgi:PAS domain S-box-containing protein